MVRQEAAIFIIDIGRKYCTGNGLQCVLRRRERYRLYIMKMDRHENTRCAFCQTAREMRTRTRKTDTTRDFTHFRSTVVATSVRHATHQIALTLRSHSSE